MGPPRADSSLSTNSVLDVDLWKRFYKDEDITADAPPPERKPPAMATSKTMTVSPSETEQAVCAPIPQSILVLIPSDILPLGAIHREHFA